MSSWPAPGKATALGFLAGLDATFSFRRGDARWPAPADEPGRALPAHATSPWGAMLAATVFSDASPAQIAQLGVHSR